MSDERFYSFIREVRADIAEIKAELNRIEELVKGPYVPAPKRRWWQMF